MAVFRLRRGVRRGTDCDSRNSWQYVSAPAVAQKAYSSITVQLSFDYNANTVYFDGIQLFREEFGTSYSYDEDGNLTSVVDLQKQVTDYEYTNNNLTKILQDNKAKVTYTYDAYHNVLTATTQEGLVYEFVYDTYGNNTSVSIGSGSTKITATATYSTDGNILLSTTDTLDKTTTYGYNENTNVLEWVQYPEDTEATRTEYTYDTMYRLASAAADTSGGLSLTADYTYTDDLLTAIETPSTTYSFFYGDFAQRSSVKIGTRTLASYAYTDDQNRRLDNLTYGNGDSVSYTYDGYGRVLSETFEDGDTVAYRYDNTGALATVTDSETGIKTTYYYDLTDRLMKYVESGSGYTHSVGYEYDTVNNLTKLVETINGIQHTTSYTYDDDNRLTSVTNDGITESYTYDAYGRMSAASIQSASGTEIETQYSFRSSGTGTTSASLERTTTTISGGVLESYYTFDDNGNITSYQLMGPGSFESIVPSYNENSVLELVYYHYDSANQLVREDNVGQNKTTIWEYDDAGNIAAEYSWTYIPPAGYDAESIVHLDYTYHYSDSSWGDLLTGINNCTFSYDEIGNPLNDGTWTYTWQHGRELASMTNGTATWAYTYDANGMRTSRTNGTDTYTYVYNGSRLVQMTKGTDTLFFTYGATGPATVTWNGVTYYYVLNGQGDVISILDGNANCVVLYHYADAWGYYPTSEGSMANTLGTLNPLRYRGYVYDTETGLYYLQSRYYNPEIGRFINADDLFDDGAELLGYNLFVYCANNPVIYKDESGESITLTCILIFGSIGLIVGAVGGSLYAKNVKKLAPSDGWDYWKYVVFGGIGGGALGGLAGWAFAGTSAAATISWTYYKATTAIGTSAYAIGHAFEQWFYKAYNVVNQQIRYCGYRFDAIYRNSIVELKNYTWSCYSSYSGLIKSFTTQASNYMQFIGSKICGQVIKGITFCFSSKPSEEIIQALRDLGVTVNWLQ